MRTAERAGAIEEEDVDKGRTEAVERAGETPGEQEANEWSESGSRRI